MRQLIQVGRLSPGIEEEFLQTTDYAHDNDEYYYEDDNINGYYDDEQDGHSCRDYDSFGSLPKGEVSRRIRRGMIPTNNNYNNTTACRKPKAVEK